MNIALSGRRCSGKSTLAGKLNALGYRTISIAAPIYRAAELSRTFIQTDDVFPNDLRGYLSTLTSEVNVPHVYAGWLELMVKHHDLLLSGRKPSVFLQDWGMMFRGYDRDVLIRAAVAACRTGDWVCDDVRMMNEVSEFRDAGWKIVRLSVPDEVRLQRVAQLYPDAAGELSHITETELDGFADWDYVVESDGEVDVAGIIAALGG